MYDVNSSSNIPHIFFFLTGAAGVAYPIPNKTYSLLPVQTTFITKEKNVSSSTSPCLGH